MVIKQEDYFPIFSSDGKIKQLEFALQAIKNYKPIVALKTADSVIIASKKPTLEKLEVRTDFLIHPVAKNIYCVLTGVPSDVQYIKMKLENIASKKKEEFGFPISPAILCRAAAEKFQKLTQKSGERISAFSAFIFGFENDIPHLYHTDSSATFYPYRGGGIGENASKINKFLEKHLKGVDMNVVTALNISLGALVEGLGSDYFPKDLEVAIVKKEGNIKYLAEDEINKILSNVFDQQ